MTVAGLFSITRPVNCIAAGLASVVAYFLATGALVPAVLLIFVIVVLVTAAGNVINDYFDIGIDRVNRPDRPIPAGLVSPSASRAYAITLFLAGILISFATNGICAAIAVINSLLLIGYAARLKSTPLFGNIAVSYLSASMFLFGGALAGMEGLLRVVPFAVMTFFAMMARELVKDAEDTEGDRASGATTLPIRYGIPVTLQFALACSILGVMASLVPFQQWGLYYGIGIGPVDAILVFGCLKACRCTDPSCVKASKASAFLKAGMFLSLAVFVSAALLL